MKPIFNFEKNQNLTLKEERICEKHGKYISHLFCVGRKNHMTGCMTCLDEDTRTAEKKRNREYAEELRINKELEEIERCAGDLYKVQQYQRSLFSNYFLHSSNEKQKKAFDKVKKMTTDFVFLEKTGAQCLFHGKPGTGKTHLAYAMIHELVKKKKVCRFISFVRFREQFMHRNNFNNLDEFNKLYSSLSNADFLVLEELHPIHDGENLSRSERDLQQYLSDLIDHRYKHGRPTVILCNKHEYATSHVAIFSRLQEGIIIDFDWEDYRKQKGIDLDKHFSV